MGPVWVPCLRDQFILFIAYLFQANHIEKYNSAKKAHGSSDKGKQCTLNFASAFTRMSVLSLLFCAVFCSQYFSKDLGFDLRCALKTF